MLPKHWIMIKLYLPKYLLSQRIGKIPHGLFISSQCFLCLAKCRFEFIVHTVVGNLISNPCNFRFSKMVQIKKLNRIIFCHKKVKIVLTYDQNFCQISQAYSGVLHSDWQSHSFQSCESSIQIICEIRLSLKQHPWTWDLQISDKSFLVD